MKQLGFYRKFRCSSSLETEIWTLYRGLTIILEKGLNNVKIESDSAIAIQMITEGPTNGHPLSALAIDAKTVLAQIGSTLGHI